MRGGERRVESEEVADVREYRLVLPILRKREMDLVIDRNYGMFVTYGEETVALPRNSLFKSLALLILGAVVVHHVSTSIRRAFLAFVSLVDRFFEAVQTVLQEANGAFASEKTGRSLSNIKKMLVIIAILLFLLDEFHVIDVTVVPQWFFSIWSFP